jgi:sigma-B regulation protein RsbU (phosphoserine phosphatase)
MDLRHRFETFAARFGEARPSALPPPVPRLPPGAGDTYWRHVADLFTRDVSRRGLAELAQDAPETFAFFTRQVDFTDLQKRPWYERGLVAVWRVFQAVAFRLSPARRVLFVVAVPVLAVAWVRLLLQELAEGTAFLHAPTLPGLVLLAGTAVLLLLVLELRDKLALKGDLEIAREIQFGLLPFDPFSRHGVTIAAAMRPANTVGGDYFDIIDVGEERVAVVVGDVAGKGIPAALLMALLQGSLRTLLSAGLRGAPLVAALNDHLYANIPANRLITLFYSELDLVTGLLFYVNAGHNAPRIVRANGAVEALPATGVALGVMRGLTYDCGGTSLTPGDALFVYTDGVTEAFDAADREYGEERLDRVLRAHAGSAPGQLLDAVRDDVAVHCGPTRLRDDLTVLAAVRSATGS